jgi:GNAT superfamily N-acetyltransferase
MIRPTLPADTPELLRMAEGTGVFSEADVVALREVLDAYHAEEEDYDHHCVTCVQEDVPIGFAYFAPASMTDRTWDLWWIVVNKHVQAKGVGGRLLRHVEETIRQEGGRLLVLDTSSLPSYELTRRFYLKHGYDEAAVVKDYYADGHGKVIYSKRLGA